jgi:hypothetical protein
MEVLKFGVLLGTYCPRERATSTSPRQVAGVVVDYRHGLALWVPGFALGRVFGAARAASRFGRNPFEAAELAMDRVWATRSMGREAAHAALRLIKRGLRFEAAFHAACWGLPAQAATEALKCLRQWGHIDGPTNRDLGATAAFMAAGLGL